MRCAYSGHGQRLPMALGPRGSGRTHDVALELVHGSGQPAIALALLAVCLGVPQRALRGLQVLGVLLAQRAARSGMRGELACQYLCGSGDSLLARSRPSCSAAWLGEACLSKISRDLIINHSGSTKVHSAAEWQSLRPPSLQPASTKSAHTCTACQKCQRTARGCAHLLRRAPSCSLERSARRASSDALALCSSRAVASRCSSSAARSDASCPRRAAMVAAASSAVRSCSSSASCGREAWRRQQARSL